MTRSAPPAAITKTEHCRRLHHPAIAACPPCGAITGAVSAGGAPGYTSPLAA